MHFFHENVLLDILSLWALCASVVFFAKHLGKSFLAVWCIKKGNSIAISCLWKKVSKKGKSHILRKLAVIINMNHF